MSYGIYFTPLGLLLGFALYRIFFNKKGEGMNKKELKKFLLVMEFVNYSLSAVVILVIITATIHGFNQ